MSSLARFVGSIVALSTVAFVACSSSTAPAGDGGTPASPGLPPVDAAAFDGPADAPGATGDAGGGCERFQLVADGVTPCRSCGFSCPCPNGFPASVASCTKDGCLTGGSCPAICQDLRAAIACSGTHTVTPAGADAGSDGGLGPSCQRLAACCVTLPSSSSQQSCQRNVTGGEGGCASALAYYQQQGFCK